MNEHNDSMLGSLEGKLEEIAANILPKGYKPVPNQSGLIDKTLFAQNLQLKKFARVMVIANVDIKDSIVNWSLGTVIDFVKTVSIENGKLKKLDPLL